MLIKGIEISEILYVMPEAFLLAVFKNLLAGILVDFKDLIIIQRPKHIMHTTSKLWLTRNLTFICWLT